MELKCGINSVHQATHFIFTHGSVHTTFEVETTEVPLGGAGGGAGPVGLPRHTMTANSNISEKNIFQKIQQSGPFEL